MASKQKQSKHNQNKTPRNLASKKQSNHSVGEGAAEEFGGKRHAKEFEGEESEVEDD